MACAAFAGVRSAKGGNVSAPIIPGTTDHRLVLHFVLQLVPSIATLMLVLLRPATFLLRAFPRIRIWHFGSLMIPSQGAISCNQNRAHFILESDGYLSRDSSYGRVISIA